MTTVEKLLVQFWERKHSIIDLVKQQTESYSQHLACEFIIDGITPPSWLLDPNTSGSKEPSKEDLISKILRPYPRPSVCGSVASYPGYTNLVINGDDEEFSDGTYVENSAFNKDLNIKGYLKAPGFSGQDHVECVLNRKPEFDASVASPKDQTGGRTLNMYTASDQSLARIQRSKSRQKALELRNSAKALAKSGIRHEIISDVVSNQIKFSLSITNQPGQNDELSQSAEPCVIGSQSCEDTNVVEAHYLSREMVVNTQTKRITGSGSYVELPVSVKGSSPLGCASESYKENASSQDAKVKRTESMPILGSEHSDNLHKKSPKSAGPSTVCCQSFQDERGEDADFLCKDKDPNVYTGGSIRSSVSSQRQSCGCDFMKSDRSSDDYQGKEITMMDSGDQPQDYVDVSLVNVNHSTDRNEGCDTRELIIEDFGRHKEKDTSPSSGSIQHNASTDEISNMEVSSVFAKVHGGISALSSAGSEKQVDDLEERSGMDKPSVGLFRRLTRSKTHFYDKEKYHPSPDNEHPNLEGGKVILDCEETSAEELQTTSIAQSVPSCFGTHGMLQEGPEARESVLEDFVRHNEMDTFLSLSSIQHDANINEFSNLEEPSLSAKAHEAIVGLSNARSARQVNHSEGLLGLVKSSDGEFHRRTRSQTRSYDNETYHPVTDEIPSLEGTKSISDCEEKSAVELQTTSCGQYAPPCPGSPDMLHDDKNGKLVVASELILLDHVDQSCLSRSNYSGETRVLESEIASTPSDFSVPVELKQLEFIETEGYNLISSTSTDGNRSLVNLPQKMSCSLGASDVSPVKGLCTGDNQPSSTKQLFWMSDVSTEEDKVPRDSSEPVFQESPDTHAEKFGPVVGSAALTDSKDSCSDAELNCRSSEVQDEADNLLSKMVDITSVQSLPVKVHVKHRSESSPVHCMEQGDCGDEGRDKGQLVSIFPERRNSRQSCSAEDQVEQSHGCSIKKSAKNQNAINETKKCTAQQSRILSWPESEVLSEHGDPSIGNKSLARPSTVRSQGDISSLTRIFTRTRTDSWPQAKRRRIELQQANSYTISAGFRVNKSHSFQRDPGNMFQKTMEVDLDTSHMEHVNIGMDDGFCSVANTARMEGIQSAILSKHGEVGSSYIKMNEPKSTSRVTNNNQLVGTISSLVMKESNNAERCFIEGTRTSPPRGDYLDTRTSADKQCRQYLRNLENASNDLSSENLDLNSTLHKETQQFPKWEDGLHVHHSALSSSNEDLQHTDVDQSILVFEDGLHVRHSVISSSNDDLQLTDVDQSRPIFEGFNISTPTDTAELDFAADGFDFGKIELSKTTLERASVLVEICKSASLDSPSSHLASAFKFQETWNLCKSVPDEGHLDQMEFGNIYQLNPDVGTHFQSCSSSSDDYKDALDGIKYSGERYGWSSRNQLSSPVGKLWDRLSSHTGSSVKCSSSNPELACFPIEEDPSSSEDNKIVEENAGDAQDETYSPLANHSNKRLPLEDLTNMCKSSAWEVILKADSVDFLTSKLRVSGTQQKPLLSPKYQSRKQSEIRVKQTSSIGAVDGRKHQLSSIGPNAIKKVKQSVNNSSRKSTRNKISRTIVSNTPSLREQDKKLSFKESRRNNIVSNVSSFIPLVQQKQAAADCPGKRDVKVKALEDAEAAKRLQERKENERKMRKEAMKIERAKMEEKRKEEERKKKDADIIAKKRLREEELKEKEKKRMRVEARQRQKEQEEKKRAERPEKENQRTKDAQMKSKKEFNNESKRQQSRETTKGESVTLQKTENNLAVDEVVNYECGASGLSCEAGEVMDAVDKSPRKEDLIVQNSKERSYEISPYQCSEDEEEDDELPTKKYVPSWASKSSIALLLPLQQKLDPDVIFPPDRFCSMDAILLPRKLQKQQADA